MENKTSFFATVAYMQTCRRLWVLLALIAFQWPSAILAQTSEEANAVENAKISSRIASLKDLPTETKQKLSQDLQAEGKKHYGFVPFKNIDDMVDIDVSQLPIEQKFALDETTLHVVDENLVPLAVLTSSIQSTGNQIYPDLQNLIASSLDDKMVLITKKVGRIQIRYQLNGAPTTEHYGAPNLVGTGFVIAPGMVATACHVLDFFTDNQSGAMSPSVSVDIDFTADPQTPQSFLITAVAGKGTLQGEDYAILTVNTTGNGGPFPDPMTLGTHANTKYLAVIGYPDLDGAKQACALGGSGCDETDQWFVNFANKNPGVIKIMSPGKKTGDFAPLGFPILTYDSPTLGGQSGSPVIDLATKNVIGIHYCCTGFKPDENEPSCAKLQPLSLGLKSSNEALAIEDVAVPH